jgi:sugar phosphate isomerase/epimerase
MADRWPLAFSTLACPAWSLERAAEFAAAEGFAALELRLLDGALIPADLPPEGRRRVRDVARQHGLTVIGLGASTRFTAPEPTEREAQSAELIRFLELASELEAPLVRTYGGTIPAGVAEEEALDWVVAGLEAVLPRAEALGVSVALETHDSFSRGAMTARVLERLPHGRLGVIWDVLHPLRHGEPVEETWRLLGSRTLHVHIKDGRPNPAAARPEEWALTLLGEGAVPVPAILRLLADGGYTGQLSVEWEKHWHPELEEPELALPQHARVLRGWMEAL